MICILQVSWLAGYGQIASPEARADVEFLRPLQTQAAGCS
jgi:hypothetical protein